MFPALLGACLVVLGIAMLMNRASYALFVIGQSTVLSILAIGAVVFSLSSARARTEEGFIFNTQPNVQTRFSFCSCKWIMEPCLVAIFVVALLFFVALRHCLLRCYDVKMDRKGVTFTLFTHIIVGRLDFKEIDRAYDPEEFWSIHGAATTKIRVFGTGNRLRNGARPIIVRRRRGLMKYIEIRTREPDLFLQRINEHLGSQALIG
jgi:hypothetical protein